MGGFAVFTPTARVVLFIDVSTFNTDDTFQADILCKHAVTDGCEQPRKPSNPGANGDVTSWEDKETKCDKILIH